MEGKSGSYEELTEALAFYHGQTVSDSKELNNLRSRLKRIIEAGNMLAASCDSGREVAAWLDAVTERPDERGMGS